jgi:hypothetical protein
MVGLPEAFWLYLLPDLLIATVASIDDLNLLSTSSSLSLDVSSSYAYAAPVIDKKSGLFRKITFSQI